MTNPEPFFDRPPIASDRALGLLAEGTAELIGRMPYSSNATFLVNLEQDGLRAQAIYKPEAGEQPLWDFPGGLYQREVAAFVMSEALGWHLVPPTVLRHDLTHGVGSLQLFMPAHDEEHYFSIREDGPAHDHAFQRIAAFDVVINNTDRKSGHCLLGKDGRIWAIDHGIAFHHEYKLRTVIWDFAGEDLAESDCDDLWSLLDRGLPGELEDLLAPIEHDAISTRTTALATAGRFPVDDSGGRRWPWPLV